MFKANWTERAHHMKLAVLDAHCVHIRKCGTEFYFLFYLFNLHMPEKIYAQHFTHTIHADSLKEYHSAVVRRWTSRCSLENFLIKFPDKSNALKEPIHVHPDQRNISYWAVSIGEDH